MTTTIEQLVNENQETNFQLTHEMIEEIEMGEIQITTTHHFDIRDVLNKEPEEITRDEWEKYKSFVNNQKSDVDYDNLSKYTDFEWEINEGDQDYFDNTIRKYVFEER